MPSDGPVRGHNQRSLKREFFCKEGARLCWPCSIQQRNSQQKTEEEVMKWEVLFGSLSVQWKWKWKWKIQKMKIEASWRL